MTRTHQFQLFLLMLIFGFLAGPRVMQALQSEPHDDSPAVVAVVEPSPFVASVAQTEEVVTEPERPTPKEVLVLEESIVPTPRIEDPLDLSAIEAKSVYVWDINAHRVLYAKNERLQVPLASLSKMMMALVAIELLPAEERVTLSTSDLMEEGDNGLYVGESWSLAKLLDLTLIASSNDGASAIASVAGATLLNGATSTDPFANKKLFVQKMNDKAKAIGLSDTYFNNESGLDVNSVTSGAYGTSRDVAMLFEYIFRKHPELFTATTYPKIDVRSEDDIVHHVANTNQGVATVSGLIGSKTGYTDLAGGNLAVIVDIGIDHPIVIVALGSSRSGRFLDVDRLITASQYWVTSTASASTN
jgi:serine-type D-Ala-D-Ala carboxypeptidase (penicillin-binding protein 5/6)